MSGVLYRLVTKNVSDSVYTPILWDTFCYGIAIPTKEVHILLESGRVAREVV